MSGRFQEPAQFGTPPSQPEADDVSISPVTLFLRIIVTRFSRSITSRLRVAGKCRPDVLGLSWCEDGAPSSLRDEMPADRCLLTPAPRSGATEAVCLIRSGLLEANLDTN